MMRVAVGRFCDIVANCDDGEALCVNIGKDEPGDVVVRIVYADESSPGAVIMDQQTARDFAHALLELVGEE